MDVGISIDVVEHKLSASMLRLLIRIANK